MKDFFDNEGYEVQVVECDLCGSEYLESLNPSMPPIYYCPICGQWKGT